MGGTGKNIDIKPQLAMSTEFCNSLTNKEDTINDFCFLINWLEAAAKKKKEKERQQHVDTLSKRMGTKWNDEEVPVLAGTEDHKVKFEHFVTIYCGKTTTEKPHPVMVTRGAKRYSSLYKWIVSRCQSLRESLPNDMVQKSRSTASTFTQVANVMSKSSNILGGIPKIEGNEPIGQVKYKKKSMKKLNKERQSVEGDPKGTKDGGDNAPVKATVTQTMIDQSAKKDKWIACNDQGTHFMTYLVKYDDYKTLPEKQQIEKYNKKYDETKFINAMKGAAEFTWLLGKDETWHTVEKKPNLNDKEIYQVAFGKKGTKLDCWAMLIPAGKKGSKELDDLRAKLRDAGVKMAPTRT